LDKFILWTFRLSPSNLQRNPLLLLKNEQKNHSLQWVGSALTLMNVTHQQPTTQVESFCLCYNGSKWPQDWHVVRIYIGFNGRFESSRRCDCLCPQLRTRIETWLEAERKSVCRYKKMNSLMRIARRRNTRGYVSVPEQHAQQWMAYKWARPLSCIVFFINSNSAVWFFKAS